MIAAVIFDLDDTLYDYHFCNRFAMEKLGDFACKQYELTSGEFEMYFSNARRLVKEQLGETASSHNRLLYMQLFLEQMGRLPVLGALDLYDVYWDNLLSIAVLYPYVQNLFNRLKENQIQIGVLTDLTAHIQHRKLVKLGVANDIDFLVTSEEVGVEKPSKRTFYKIQKKIKYSCDNILMVGDNEKRDVEGAQSAGMHALQFKKQNAYNMGDLVMEYINETNKGNF